MIKPRLPFLGIILLKKLYRKIKLRESSEFASQNYWETRYSKGGTSGEGSYGDLAEFKARILNQFIADHDIKSAVEWGCGDGNQLSMLKIKHYTEVDVSETAINQCKSRFREKEGYRFMLDHPGVQPESLKTRLSLSLDVIYHLIEDDVYEVYLRNVFMSAEQFTVIYSTDTDEQANAQSVHVRHRRFTRDVKEKYPEFELIQRIENEFPDKSAASFFLYRRR